MVTDACCACAAPIAALAASAASMTQVSRCMSRPTLLRITQTIFHTRVRRKMIHGAEGLRAGSRTGPSIAYEGTCPGPHLGRRSVYDFRHERSRLIETSARITEIHLTHDGTHQKRRNSGQVGKE